MTTDTKSFFTPSRESSMRSLSIAQEVKTARSDTLNDLSQLRVSLEEALGSEWMGKCYLNSLLESLPHRNVLPHGRAKSTGSAIRIGKRAKIDTGLRVSELDDTAIKSVLDAAYDVASSTAWIFAVDTPPRLRPATHRSREVFEAGREVREAALEKGNAVRQRRKAMRLGLADGSMALEEVLRDEASATWELGKILKHLRPQTKSGSFSKKRAPVLVDKILKAAGVTSFKQAGTLTDRQIELLVKLVEVSYHTKFQKRGFYKGMPAPSDRNWGAS